MRYFIATRSLSASLTAVLALTGVACTGARNGVGVQNEQGSSSLPLVSTVRMSDPTAGAQLLSGFYGLENGAWRWTAGKFSVRLLTPPAAAQSGATLTLSFTVPDVVIRKLGTIALNATINGTTLTSTEYNAAGSYVFSADVPASMLTAESVKVDFALDKTMRPDVDKRELGIIANSVAIGAR
jgi:hypothetical protein